MALMDLNRAQGPQIATLKLSTIAPINWHRFPPRVATMVKANSVNEPKPRYLGAGATADWLGGDHGDDVDEASANVVAVDANGTAIANYAPRNQDARATQMGRTLAVDVSRSRGVIDPRTPYPTASTPAVPIPVLTTVTPNTAVHGTQEITCLVVGTGFTPWTEMRVGGETRLTLRYTYLSPTLINITINPAAAPAGAYQLQAVDHDVESNQLPFTLT